MATANEQLFDASIRHQIYLQRYSGTVVNRFVALLNRSDTDLVESIQLRLSSIEGKGFDGGPQVTKRLQALLVEIRDLNAAAYSVAGKGLLDDLRTFAVYETEWQASALDKALPEGVSVTAPSARTVAAAAIARPFQGRLLKEWLDGLEGAKAARVRDAIRLGMVEGEAIDQMVRRIRGSRALGYADGLMEIDRRGAAALVRTAVNHVGSVARDAVAADNSDILKGERWTATLDGRTSAVCRGRDGTIYPVGKGPKPPAHIGCLPGDSLVLARCGISGASKRWFDGEMIVVRTASGRELTCTPNHPILTGSGWVAAQNLKLSGNVISDGGSEWTAVVDRNNKDVPASIHDVTEALFRHRDVLAVPMPVATPDFHGDGMDGDVAVVGAYLPLGNDVKASLFKHFQQGQLVAGFSSFSFGVCFGREKFRFRAFFETARCMIRSAGQRLSFLVRRSRHSCELLLASISGGYSSFNKPTLNSAGADPQCNGDASDADALGEHFYSQGQVDNCALVGFIGEFKTGTLQDSVDQAFIESRLADDLRNGCACKVFTDAIVSIDRFCFSGHVYNLETADGWYSAGGIITHNCRSLRVAILSDEFADLRLEGQRASMNGPVRGDETYQTWLKRQPVSFQDDALGKAKAQLFRKGGLTLDRFTNQAGDELTLDQLRIKEPSAFAKAGLPA